MRGRFGASILITALAVGMTLSCAPVDEVPPPDGEKQARIAQIAQVLQAIGAGQPPSAESLTERLESLCRFPPAEAASHHLAQTLIEGLAAARLSREASERVAADLYALMNGGYLTRDRLQRATRDVQQELANAGASAAASEAVRAAGVRAAREQRNPRADWW